ncbi:Septal ring factor EnvC, activator of murein hydrolases AmiA and AmiB [Spirosomataceae bacterium TFI 002]|nr:Septal ring factor EnvC, activator of murein hydrolases AmiA and AmiB [Spirosomataceae bacterium TFI 002]
MIVKGLKFFALLTILTLVSSEAVWAQSKSREQLEKEKKQNLIKIQAAEKILAVTRKKKSSTIGKVKALNHQINSQKGQLELLEEDILLIDLEIVELEKASAELDTKLQTLKEEYADMLYLASKSSSKLNKLSFLFASNSFNELIMRYKYLEQYTESRKMQVRHIAEITATLKTRQQELIGKKGEKRTIITQKQTESLKLEKLKNEQTLVVNELSQEEKKIRKEINESKRALKRLDNLINAIVSRSIAKTSTANEASNAASVALSSSFQGNRNKLPWPVSSGFISDKFGVKNHPVLKGVRIDNNGVDIQTSANAPVSSVFDGIVMDISQIPGLNNVVAIQHGDYYTVYANLSSVSVQINQKVIARQTIGVAGQKDGVYEINFQVWKKFDKQNPELWLNRK